MSKTQQHANNFYREFSNKEGNQHIATLFAIKKVLDIIKDNRPVNILEIGLGIGSISYSILQFAEAEKMNLTYYGTEANSFCLDALKVNLREHYNNIHLFPKLGNIPDKQFDLVVIDGSDDTLASIKNMVSRRAVIFIEGDRKSQLEKIQEIFPKSLFVHSISNYRNPQYGPFDAASWSGGCKIIYINPSLKQRLKCYSEKLRTAYLNRFIRNFN